MASYNTFNIDRMIQDLEEQVVFENIHNGEVTMVLTGLPAFKQQAEQAKTYFSARTPTIKSVKHWGETTEVEIDYKANLSQHLPNGLKKGQELLLTGKTAFQFSGNRLIKITDIS
ncbi:nuclear transport factor 2 family protein [Adhaeribacter pallidiroseus]|uniref:SnoaL-like domain-containing protein n=1 Tax=Adhaeribacter pallidiroseus TaxID=2072847 RepID=A0A369QLN9_9BACT|nr:nuclear transport factor 2 family protein [Adhaeribacter pallidiroseus]RDC63759.1 hypothetical protein AHMF7616_02367 [Adhaeribacter pallidiroseus]